MLMLLSNIVEVDVGDWIVVTVSQVKEEVFGAIEVDPLFSIKVMSWHFIRLKHLGL